MYTLRKFIILNLRSIEDWNEAGIQVIYAAQIYGIENCKLLLKQ